MNKTMKIGTRDGVELGSSFIGEMTSRMMRATAVACILVTALIWSSFYVVRAWGYVTDRAEEAYRAALAKVTRVEVRRELVRADSVPLRQLIETVALRHGVSPVVLQAVVEQESRGGEALYRFEPGSYARLKSQVKATDSELRMLASSHGVAHVMGFNAQPRCGVHWSKLYDPSIGLECAAKILRQNLARHSNEATNSKRIWLALRDYNGAGPDAQEYATEVMARIGALLLSAIDESAK
jgi:hypothetical protein